MTSREVRDMLGLGPASQAQQKRPLKKAKTAAKRPDGMARELFALIGERQPPIPIVAAPKQYKAKLQKANENVRWRETAFTNPARRDDLVLHHWVRNILDAPAPKDSTAVTAGTATATPTTQEPPAAPATEGEKPEVDQSTPADPPVETGPATTSASSATVEPTAVAEPEPQVEAQPDEYRFAKYNLQVEAPKYTDEEYNTHLANETWSREETDYLMELYNDFYGKWPLVVDRWDFKVPTGDDQNSAGQGVAPERTMEELKARFYQVAAAVMALRTPVSNMTAAEFEDHEKMVKFDPAAETKRKRAAGVLQHRSTEDRREEEYLLAELRRIWNQQDRFALQLKDLRDRLDHSLTDDKGQGGSFTTHAEITALFQKMLANDRNKKRRPQDGSMGSSIPGMNSGMTSGRSGGAVGDGAVQHKRQSTGGPASGPSHRQLGPRQEARFGVSTHERLTSGVTFRSEKLNKVRQAKSQAQMKKIADVLAELGVPEIIQMPTGPVTEALEKLVAKVHLLLDARKMREKEENEILIERQRRDIREGKTTDEANKPKEQEEEEEEEEDVEVPEQKKDEDEDEDDDDDGEGNGDADVDGDEEGEDEEEDEEEEEEDGEGDQDNQAEVEAEESDHNEQQDDDEDAAEADIDVDSEEPGIDADGEEGDAEVNEDEEEAGEEAGEDDSAEPVAAGDEDEDEDQEDGEDDDDNLADTTLQSETLSEMQNETLSTSNRPGTRNGKRSASELSDGSLTGTKRQKK